MGSNEQALINDSFLQYFDQDPEILRFDYQITPNTLNLSEELYDRYEELINKFKVETKHYEIHTWNDSSGFDYWNYSQEENNYIMFTIELKTEVITEELIKELEESFHNLYMFLYEELKSFLPISELMYWKN